MMNCESVSNPLCGHTDVDHIVFLFPRPGGLLLEQCIDSPRPKGNLPDMLPIQEPGAVPNPEACSLIEPSYGAGYFFFVLAQRAFTAATILARPSGDRFRFFLWRGYFLFGGSVMVVGSALCSLRSAARADFKSAISESIASRIVGIAELYFGYRYVARTQYGVSSFEKAELVFGGP